MDVGLECLKEIADNNYHFPVLLHTQYTLAHNVDRAMDTMPLFLFSVGVLWPKRKSQSR